MNGENVEILVTGLSVPRSVALDLPRGKMYWTHEHGIQRADLDGSNVETVIALGFATYAGIAIDSTAEKLYWANASNGTLSRAALDGSGIELLANGHTASIWGVALDQLAGKICWSQWGPGMPIQRADLDGANVEVVVPAEDFVAGLSIDSDEGRLYWSNSLAATLKRANLDGSDVQTLLSVPDVFVPLGIAFDGRGAHDGDVDWSDFRCFQICYAATNGKSPLSPWCDIFDADENGEMNVKDFVSFNMATERRPSRN